MNDRLAKGGNIAWSHPRAALRVAGLPAASNVIAFLVTETGNVRGDADFVFFGNPSAGGVSLSGHTADVDLGQIPIDIERIVIAAVLDDSDVAPLSAQPLQVTVDPGGLDVPLAGLTTERAVVLVEIYRRSGQWKLRNVSAGWAEGFSALVRAHGVDVDESEPTVDQTAQHPSPPAAQAAATSAGTGLDLRKPGVDAIDLGKRTGSINLRKGQQVTITKTQQILATCTWPRATDYDIYALIRYRDGHCETVATFGTADHEQAFTLTTTDGAVRHRGDVGRAPSKGWGKKAAQVGEETIEINLTPDILAVLPVVYSAQSNGTGSFREYQVSMAIHNGSGDTVTIDAGNASDDDMVFTCVPGVIINDPDGVRIQFLELYSAGESEHRPEIGDDLIVTMDSGPINAFK